MVRAFGEENRSSDFDWEAVYGGGFDVVNFVTAMTIKLVLGPDPVANLRVLLSLAENGLRYEITPPEAEKTGRKSSGELPLYIEPNGTEVAGDINILNHLVQHFPVAHRPGAPPLQGGDRIAATDELRQEWREHQERRDRGVPDAFDTWEDALEEQYYLGGAALNIDDCALWPVLREIVQDGGPLSGKIYPNLAQYYQRVLNRVIVKKTLEEIMG
jgi:glutathione S-transferase